MATRNTEPRGLDLVLSAARHGHLTDPGPARFGGGDGGLPLHTHRRIHRYPSVFYSPYQLLGLRQVQELIQEIAVRAVAAAV